MEQTIDVILKETVTETVTVDKEVAETVRTLVIDALDEARWMLKYGLADQKMALMKILLSGATRTLGKDFTSTEQEARFALDRMFSTIRDIQATDENIRSYGSQSALDDHAEPQALAEGVDDPDEGADN